MALIKCKECGKEVSTTAKACTNCGAKPSKPVGLLGIILTLFMGVGVYQCSSRSASVQAPPTPAIASSATSPVSPPPPLAAALSKDARAKIIMAATKDLKLNRDKIEKTSFYLSKNRNQSNSGIEAYIGISDGGSPYLRVRPIYYGDNWVFFDKIKVMANDEIVYEKTFPRSAVARDNAAGSVWETADYIAEKYDLVALRKIASSSSATIRFDGRDRQHDHKITSRESASMKVVLDAYDKLKLAL
jgi:hypothetical protein